LYAAIRKANTVDVKNPWIFFGVCGSVIAYLLYMMIRKRKGERPGTIDKELEL
jgi:hypothetical protein